MTFFEKKFDWFQCSTNDNLLLTFLYICSDRKSKQILQKRIMAAAITSKSRDFYAILGIERTAGQGQIKQAYR